MFNLRTIRAICYIKPNQNSENTCHSTFMTLCAYSPLTFLQPMARLFRSEQTMQSYFYFPGKFSIYVFITSNTKWFNFFVIRGQ